MSHNNLLLLVSFIFTGTISLVLLLLGTIISNANYKQHPLIKIIIISYKANNDITTVPYKRYTHWN